MGFVKEFREFAVKGNAVDMAVGIVIGAAFTKVVNSLVNDIIMPGVGILLSGVEFKDLKWVLRPEVLSETGKEITPEAAIRYGQFINTTIDFLIVAVAIFLVVRTMNRVIRRREQLENPA